MSSIALQAPSSLLAEVLAMSARLHTAWSRPPKTSPDEIANEIRDVLRGLVESTATLVRFEGELREVIAKVDGHADDPDHISRDFAAAMVADAEAMLARLALDLEEDTLFGRPMKQVVEPFNDAARKYRRALQDYLASCRRVLAAIDAHAAADARLARAVVADDSDPIIPWAAVRDDVRKIP